MVRCSYIFEQGVTYAELTAALILHPCMTAMEVDVQDRRRAVPHVHAACVLSETLGVL